MNVSVCVCVDLIPLPKYDTYTCCRAVLLLMNDSMMMVVVVMAMIDFSDIDVSHCGGYSRKENRMRNDSPPFVCIGCSRTGCVSTN